MKINVMKKGDAILNATSDYVVVRRKNGEVDILFFVNDETGMRIDKEKTITFGYGNNIVEVKKDNIKITTF